MSKMVIVDADASFAESINHLMQPHGFRAVVTGDGDAALDLIRGEKPDLVIVNVELTRGSGYSLCNRIKRNAELSSIPLILLSSQATPEAFAQHQSLATRADAYMLKPFDPAELLGHAQRLLPDQFNGESVVGVASAAAPQAPQGDDEDVLAVSERGVDGAETALDAAFSQGPGAGFVAASEGSMGAPPPLPGGSTMPPPIPRGGRTGRSARGASLDELLRGGRPEEQPAQMPVTAGPEARQQFFRDQLRRRETDMGRARELWAAREREVQSMEDALDKRTRELDVFRDQLRDTEVKLSASEERLASLTAESAILDERVQRMERERDAMLQEAENTRDAHERAQQEADDRFAALDAQRVREGEEQQSVIGEREATIGNLERELEQQRTDGNKAAADAHDREMALTRDKEGLRAELDEERGTREGVQLLLKDETEARIKVASQLADIKRAKEEADRAAEKMQADLSSKVSTLTAERDELEKEREINLGELAQRADQLARLETRAADLEAALAEEAGKVTDLERTLYERGQQLEEHTAELANRAARIQSLDGELERAVARGASMEQRIAEMREAADTEARERSETERGLREHTANLESTLKEQELRAQTLDADVARLQAALEASRSERDALAERLGERDAELADEQRGHTATREKLEGQLLRERKLAAEQKTTSDRKDSEQQARILQLETDHATITEVLKNTEADLTQTRQRLGDAERGLRQTKETLDETAAEREQLRGQVADYQGQVRRKTENETRLNAELGVSQARASALETEVEALREQHGMEKGELDAARQRTEERARAKLTELTQQLGEIRGASEDMRSQLEVNQVHAQELENELLALRAERDAETRGRADAEARLETLTRSLTELKDRHERGERDRLALRGNQQKMEKLREQVQTDLASAEARHKVELETLRGELRQKDRALAESQEAANREKSTREREKQGLQRVSDDERRALQGKVEELTLRLDRSEQRAAAAEKEANSERTTRVRERAAAKVQLDSMQTRLAAMEGEVGQGGGEMVAQLEKAAKDKEERIEDLEGELQMVSATLQDASNKNKRLQEELARKTVGGAEAAELRKKYNELVARYRTREDERKKLTEDYQRALEGLAKYKAALTAAKAAAAKPG